MEKIGNFGHLQKSAWHYESTVKMAFFICFRSVLAVLAAILKVLYLVYVTHIVSFKYLPVVWALIYGKKMASNAINMELENTLFLIAPVQFLVVRIYII